MRSSGPAYDDCVRVNGTILNAVADGLFMISLPNGKEVLGHLSKSLAAEQPEICVDSVVLLEMSPFDLDRARIARIEKIPE